MILRIALVGLGLAIAVAVARAHEPVAAPSSPLEGKPAPTFVAKTLDGDEVDLSKEKGNVVVMDFWATWCAPCKVSLPHVEAMSKDPELVKRGLKVWAIDCLKLGKESEQKARDYVKESGFTFTVPLDAEGLATKNFGIKLIPVTLVIGRDGVVKKHFTGYPEGTEQELRQAVEEALREKPQ